MRFLLHQHRFRGGRPTRPPSTSSTAVVSSVDASLSSSNPTTPAHRRREAWGQQCSPQCGCVIRFEAVSVGENGTGRGPKATVETASYLAKQLIVVPASSSSTTSSSSSAASTSAGWIPALTVKGRPMFRPSPCSALHHLAQAVVHHAPGKKWDDLRNGLEFRSVRSGPAFRSAVLSAQDLQPIASHHHCFDLVEEAYTALVKGHLPRPRPTTPQAPATPQPIPPATAPPGRWWDPATAPSPPAHREWSLDQSGTADDEYDLDDGSTSSRTTYETQIGDDDDPPQYPNLVWRPSEPGSSTAASRFAVWNSPQGSRMSPYSSSSSSSSALRWFDLDLLDREQKRLARLRSATNTTGPGQQRRVPRDWVSYVDELQYPHYQQQHQQNVVKQQQLWRDNPRDLSQSKESSG